MSRRRRKSEFDIVRWQAWYVGGDTRAGRTFGGWEKLPADGMLSVVVVRREGTRRIMQGDDLYWATPDGVFGHDSRYSEAEILERYPGASIKRGQWTTDAEMQRVAEEVETVAVTEA